MAMKKLFIAILFFSLTSMATVSDDKTFAVMLHGQWGLPPWVGTVVGLVGANFEYAFAKDVSLTIPAFYGAILHTHTFGGKDAFITGAGIKYYFSHSFLQQKSLQGFYLKPELHVGFSPSTTSAIVELATIAGYTHAFDFGLILDVGLGAGGGYYGNTSTTSPAGKTVPSEPVFGVAPKLALGIGYAW